MKKLWHRRSQQIAKQQAKEGARIVRYSRGERVYDLVAAVGLALSINNFATHWIFEDGRGFVAEWWPHRGRLVFNREYGSAEFHQDFRTVLRRIVDHRTMTPSY